MVQSVLGSVTLGYRPLWNRSREIAGVQLFVHEGANPTQDAVHLLRIIDEIWVLGAPPLLLSIRPAALLHELLQHAQPGAPVFEVPLAWLRQDAALAATTRQAAARGVKLALRTEPGEAVLPDVARLFERRVIHLGPQAAMQALQAQAARRQGQANARPSPVQPGQIYEGVASRALVQHCLDQQGAWAVSGWPAEDVLHAWRYQALQPSHRVVTQLLLALDTEQSMERLEQIISDEPLLVYRMLTFVNSAAMGLRTGIGSIRHALMMMGVNSLKTWLTEQLPHASSDADLQPVRLSMVLRASLVEELMETGIEEDLRREVYLCGLFSQIDLLQGEPLATVLQRLPLSERIHAATVLGTGPYAGALLAAIALESPEPGNLAVLAAEHEMDLEEINRGLLRMLAGIRR
ncbi:MAG: HDOD domain-containing protein [Burkholderiaceae bacterium]|nr:HDOD domain-containing protein [Burkholderiaceae bacterium]